MSANSLMQNGYLGVTRSTGTPRDVEYHMFSRVTGKLNQTSGEDAHFPDLAAALNENLNLWRTIALDVADGDNALPEMLRAQLFYLYEFTSAHTRKVLQRKADTAALIEINRLIMRGLKQK